MHNQKTVTLEDYRKSNIEKGFNTESNTPTYIIDSLIDSFDKGLIGEDLFDKAIEELNLLEKAKKANVGEIRKRKDGKSYKKTLDGWKLESEGGEKKEEKKEGGNGNHKDVDEKNKKKNKTDKAKNALYALTEGQLEESDISKELMEKFNGVLDRNKKLYTSILQTSSLVLEGRGSENYEKIYEGMSKEDKKIITDFYHAIHG